MDNSIGRRQVLTGAGAALLLTALEGCGAGMTRGPSPPARLQLPPLNASTDRITRITVCTRPFRAEGPRLDVEQVGAKTIVHNYGHGGSGWSLSWGSSTIAVQKAMATGERSIAVIGCGALGLTSGLLLQRTGAEVVIYAKDLPPNARSSLATGVWSPDSRICLRSTRRRHSKHSGKPWPDNPSRATRTCSDCRAIRSSSSTPMRSPMSPPRSARAVRRPTTGHPSPSW